jgi:hypothetical protein
MGEHCKKMKNPMHEARKALMRHPKCGSYARTTGKQCLNPAMKNGRCRMHGGKSTGRSIIHGMYTKERKQKYAEAKDLLRSFKEMLCEC